MVRALESGLPSHQRQTGPRFCQATSYEPTGPHNQNHDADGH